MAYTLFPVKFPVQDQVFTLKKNTQKARELGTLRDVDPHILELWKLKDMNAIPIEPEDTLLERIRSMGALSEFAEELEPSDILSEIFPTQPSMHHVHITVKIPGGKRKPAEPAEGVFDRLKRTKLVTNTPSETGRPSTYLDLQNRPSEKLLEDRPQPDDIPPLPLLYDGFGHFLDVVAGRDDVPGVADVNVPELEDAVDDFATKMTRYFDNEYDRRDVGIQCLNKIFAARRGTIIPPIAAAAIGSVLSDVYNVAIHGPGTLSVSFKTAITSVPVAEVTGSVARLNSRMDRQLYEGWRVPCLGLTVVGRAITFYAIIAIDHRFRIIPLTPTFSCNKSASDGQDRFGLYSAFTASSMLQARIIQDATRLLNDPPAIIPTHARSFPAVSKIRKYPPSNEYLRFEIQSFSPERLPNRLLYIAETLGSNKQRVLIKFARRYSIELHDFCAGLGHAPPIYAFERLPGRWCAVAMKYVESAIPITDSPLLPTHRQIWKDQLQMLINNFHPQDLLHGDLRGPNVVCEKESVMLLDFDWGGKEGEACYPTLMLNEELLAGRVSKDLRITKDDDRRVLANTLNKLG